MSAWRVLSPWSYLRSCSLTWVISLSDARQLPTNVPVLDSSKVTVPFENPVAINVSLGLVVTTLIVTPKKLVDRQVCRLAWVWLSKKLRVLSIKPATMYRDRKMGSIVTTGVFPVANW